MVPGLLAGALLGFGYYYFIGCKSGTCAITSNPLISTAYGALIGIIYTWPGKKLKKSQELESKADAG